MSEVKNLIVNDDGDLIKRFLECIDEMKYIREHTKNAIKEIKHDYSINVQNEVLLKSWGLLLGDAIIYLKSQDEREIINDEMRLGLKELCKYIKEFQQFEPIFYGIHKNYRDHIEHVFRTFLLGDYLIRNNIGYENISPVDTDLKISKEEKEAMWCIIALCHDMGYPLQGFQDLNDPIRNILKSFGCATVSEFGYGYPLFSNTSDFALKYMSSKLYEVKEPEKEITIGYLTHIQPKYYQKFSSAFSKYNHGVLSAILLMKDLVYFKESDYTFDNYKYLDKKDARQFLIRRNIIRAIASHSCNDIYYLNCNDFSFLIKVFDEMQEWGRPRLIDIIDREESINKLKVDVFNNNHVKYTITFEGEEKFLKRATENEVKKVKKEVETYFAAKCGEWLNVLRSAVDGDKRDLLMEFVVIDKIPPEEVTYSLYHKKPNDFKILPETISNEILRYWTI